MIKRTLLGFMISIIVLVLLHLLGKLFIEIPQFLIGWCAGIAFYKGITYKL